ncbi:MAG: hypothetical protein JW947_01580 [Sedimentisphaerales bacterium]|nr:hypothetical protein [Sedimentisphaerales bacterium]
MSAEETIKPEPKKKTKKRTLRRAAALAAIVIALAVFALPWFVSSEKGRRMILAKINSSVDGKMDFASLTMSWWKGIKVRDIGFNDNAGRISVRVRQVTTKPYYASVFTGGLSLGETEILEPRVEVNLAASEAETVKSPQKEKAAAKEPQPIALPIKRVELIVKDGSLKVTDAKAETVELSQINSRLNLQSPGEQTDFDMALAVVSGNRESRISANGQVVPSRGWRLEGASGEVTVEVNDLELGSLASLFAMGGIEVQAKGNVSGIAAGEIRNGKLEKMRAEVKGKDLDVDTVKLTGGRFKTSRLGANVKLARAREMINIESFDVKSDWFAAEGRGTIPTTIGSLDKFLKTDSSLSGNFEIDTRQLFAQMPGLLKLKEGMNVTSGTLKGDIATLMEGGRRKIKGQATLERLAGMIDGRSIALSEPVRAEAEITTETSGVRFDKLALSSAFAKIDCSGTSELFKYGGDIDLGRFQAELGQFVDTKGYGIAGELSGQGEAAIREDKIAIKGSSTVRNFRLISADGVSATEPAADANFAVAVKRGEGVLEVDYIKVNAGMGKVDVKDAVLPLDKEAGKEMRADISAKDVDLQKVRPFAVLLSDFPKEMQLSGTAETQIGVRSEKDRYFIAAEGTRIKKLKVNYPGKAPFEQKEVSAFFDAEVDSAQKAVIVKKFQIESDQIKVRGDFSKADEGGKTKVASRAECEYDWAAVSTIAAPVLPAGLVLEGQRKDTISFTSEYPKGQDDKLLENLNAKVKAGFTKGNYFGLNFGQTEADVQIEDGLLKIAPFSTTANNGQLNFAGEANFKQKPTLLKTPGILQIVKDVQINDEVARELLRYLNPVFANAVRVSGTANFECEKLAIPLAGGDKNDIEVAGTVSMKKVRLETSDLLGQILTAGGLSRRGVDITIHPTRFLLQKGFLRYDNMQMDVGENPVNFRGVIGLDKSLNMSVTLPYTAEGKTVKVGEKVEGERISLPLKGTVDKPELDLGKLLEDQLMQRLMKELEGVLKK